MSDGKLFVLEEKSWECPRRSLTLPLMAYRLLQPTVKAGPSEARCARAAAGERLRKLFSIEGHGAFCEASGAGASGPNHGTCCRFDQEFPAQYTR